MEASRSIDDPMQAGDRDLEESDEQQQGHAEDNTTMQAEDEVDDN
jgi:hypothetical protein